MGQLLAMLALSPSATITYYYLLRCRQRYADARLKAAAAYASRQPLQHNTLGYDARPHICVQVCQPRRVYTILVRHLPRHCHAGLAIYCRQLITPRYAAIIEPEPHIDAEPRDTLLTPTVRATPRLSIRRRTPLRDYATSPLANINSLYCTPRDTTRGRHGHDMLPVPLVITSPRH